MIAESISFHDLGYPTVWHPPHEACYRALKQQSIPLGGAGTPPAGKALAVVTVLELLRNNDANSIERKEGEM